MNKVIQERLPGLLGICQRNGIRRLELFGSAARDDFQSERSDLDFVATFDHIQGSPETFFEALQQLENLFGHEVDLLEADAITNPFIGDEIERDRIVLCERVNGIVMVRNPGAYLHDSVIALAAIARYIAGKSLDDYLRGDLLQAAVERRFEIAGDALNQLFKSNPSLVSRISDLRAIVGFRNLLAHEYSAISNLRVWELAQTRVPVLLKEIEALIQEIS